MVGLKKRRKNASPAGTFFDPARPNVIIDISAATGGRGNFLNKRGLFALQTRKRIGERKLVTESISVKPRKEVFDLIQGKKLRKARDFGGSAGLTRG